jgi:pyruvate formate lyase activating enzyme
MSVPQVLAEIEKDRAFYDQSGGGVTFSGGEPLMQPEFLLALLEACGERDLHRTVDTTGYAPEELMEAVARLTELVLYDLKHMDTQRHKILTGVPNEPILTNLKLLAAVGANLWVRIPLIPGLNDDSNNLVATGKFISELPDPPAVHILPFHCAAKGKYERLAQTFTIAGVQPPTNEQMTNAARHLRDFGLHVTIGGESHDAPYRATA